LNYRKDWIRTVSDEKRILLMADFIEQKVRKEQELDYYIKQLEELQMKIGYLRREVDLTNTIIDIIKQEAVYDVKEQYIEKHSDKLIIQTPEQKSGE